MTTSHSSSQPERKVDRDAIIVGAGFSGIYMLHKLRNDLGLDAVAIDKAPGVGGTWYWNRYPGALSDSPSFYYCYGFDDDLLQDWTFKNRYVSQPEVLAYLEHVVERFDLGRSIKLSTALASAAFDEDANLWTVTYQDGSVETCTYFISAMGAVHEPLIPDILGLDDFEGTWCHTSTWPEGLDYAGKRVAVIGTGSSGTQVVPAVAPVAEQVTVFVRSPQYSVPINNRPLTEQEIADVKGDYRRLWELEFASDVGFGIHEPPTQSALDATPEEREVAYNWAWNEGGPFHFFVGTYNDILTNRESNQTVVDFLRRKIASIVKDPETARGLTPDVLWARRPVADNGYFEAFNRENVKLELVKDNPIEAITPRGIRLANGDEHEFDIIVFATGFDGMTGQFNQLDIRGLDGRSLGEQWKDGAAAQYGMSVSNFPNMFMIYGPYGAFANNPAMIASEVEFIADFIDHARKDGIERIVVRGDVEAAYVEACEEQARGTVMYDVDSWLNGANVPGKPRQFMFNICGLGAFRELVREEADSGYPSYELTRRPVSAAGS